MLSAGAAAQVPLGSDVKARAQPQASHYIDGAYVEDTDGRVIDCIYPATGEVIARLHSATPAVIERAVASARRAQGEWERTVPAERGRILRRAADIMRERNHDLSVLETLDTGKPYQETIVADALSGAEAFEFYGGLASSINGECIPLGESFVYTKRVALGVCLGIGAWNYPTQIACYKGAAALACGNAVVFKPSEVTPLCALQVAEILVEAGLPKGLYNVVQGYGDVGSALVAHPDIEKISLTGSVPTGARVMAAAGEDIKHVTMELGGKSPLIVFEDADIETAVSGAILGNFYSTGQICSNGTRVFVHRDMRAEFEARLIERVRAIRLGDPLDPETQMGPLISAAHMDKVLGYMQLGQQEGARLLYGGERAEVEGFEDGSFVQPTVFTGVSDDMRIAREEIFGPVMSILEFEDEDEVIRRANDTGFGLAASVFTRDLQRAHRVIDRIQAGTCWINTHNVMPVEMPFGGVKKSGVGRENSRAALDHYSQIKSVYVEMGGIDAPY
ncbi:betaine-aldehyde dehydrogenase [Leisingera sp. ANG-M1]|uniref:betaine-aldehyde dehydrogenase n=1 Tax=Leisingera sp. ANG-M1 TaxID=1577895 RepID=UPI000690FF94|nr:betaine-aldehyde dehydrogenase [Leisingera sp. ANG-M1]